MYIYIIIIIDGVDKIQHQAVQPFQQHREESPNISLSAPCFDLLLVKMQYYEFRTFTQTPERTGFYSTEKIKYKVHTMCNMHVEH